MKCPKCGNYIERVLQEQITTRNLMKENDVWGEERRSAEYKEINRCPVCNEDIELDEITGYSEEEWEKFEDAIHEAYQEFGGSYADDKVNAIIGFASGMIYNLIQSNNG